MIRPLATGLIRGANAGAPDYLIAWPASRCVCEFLAFACERRTLCGLSTASGKNPNAPRVLEKRRFSSIHQFIPIPEHAWYQLVPFLGPRRACDRTRRPPRFLRPHVDLGARSALVDLDVHLVPCGSRRSGGFASVWSFLGLMGLGARRHPSLMSIWVLRSGSFRLVLDALVLLPLDPPARRPPDLHPMQGCPRSAISVSLRSILRRSRITPYACFCFWPNLIWGWFIYSDGYLLATNLFTRPCEQRERRGE